MRIALVSQEYPPAPHGGLGTQTYQKAQGLSRLGHDIVVISHAAPGVAAHSREGSVEVIRLPGCEDYLPCETEIARWQSRSVQVAQELSRQNARRQLDIVDFAEWGCEGYTYLLNRTEWIHTRVVIQLHGPLVMLAHTIHWPAPDSEFYRVGTHMEQTCLRLADAVYSSSRVSRQWCQQHYSLDLAAAPVLHTGVDTSSFKPVDGMKSGTPTVVFAGKVVANKGVDILVSACTRLAAEIPGLRLKLIGRSDPALMRDLRDIAERAGRPDLIEAVEFVDRQNLPAALAQADLFAAPSVYEGGPGFVYLEAMACGLPVIACSGSGASEAIIPEETGILVPPNDVSALTDALRAVLTDADRRHNMSRRARDHVVNSADSAACVRRIGDFYADVVRGR